jgi:predicted CoA-binding protein
MTKQMEFLDAMQHVAFYGLKRSGKGFAYDVLHGLEDAYPKAQFTAVHPEVSELDGHEAVKGASAIEPKPDAAIIVLKPGNARQAIDDVHLAGIPRLWLVMGCDSRDNIEYARGLGMAAIGGCPLLFITGLGFPHNFHRWLAKLFGKL